MSQAEPSHESIMFLERSSIIFMFEAKRIVPAIPCYCHLYLLFCGQVKLGRDTPFTCTVAEAVKRATIYGDFILGVSRQDEICLTGLHGYIGV